MKSNKREVVKTFRWFKDNFDPVISKSTKKSKGSSLSSWDQLALQVNGLLSTFPHHPAINNKIERKLTVVVCELWGQVVIDKEIIFPTTTRQ